MLRSIRRPIRKSILNPVSSGSRGRSQLTAAQLVQNIARYSVFNPDSATNLNLTQDNTSDRSNSVTSNEVVHPSVVYFPGGWNGHKYWMAITGYNTGNDQFENPSIMFSDDGIVWFETGITNPVFLTPSGTDYQADTCLWYDPSDDRLHMTWFRTKSSRTDIGIQYSNSADGVNWVAEQEILDGSVSGGIGDVLSQAVVIESDGTISMYTVDAQTSPNILNRRTASSVTGAWTGPTVCTFDSLPFDTEIWHIEIRRYGNLYLAVLTLQADNSDANDTHIRLAWSSDGLAFTVQPEPLITPRRNTLTPSYDSDEIYQGSLIFADNPRIFYTCRNSSGAWSFAQADVEEQGPDFDTLGTRILDWSFDYRTDDPVTNGGTFAKTDGDDVATSFAQGTPALELDGVRLVQEGFAFNNRGVVPLDMNYTFAARIKLTETPADESGLFRFGPLLIGVNENGLFRLFRQVGASVAGYAAHDSFDPPIDEWFVVVASTNGTTHRIYFGGYFGEQSQSLVRNDLINIGISISALSIYPGMKISSLRAWDGAATHKQMKAIHDGFTQ